MKLVSDWRRVLARAWSVWLMASTAAVVIIIEPIIGLLADLSVGWGPWISFGLKLLSGLFSLAAIWARVTKQKDFEDGT